MHVEEIRQDMLRVDHDPIRFCVANHIPYSGVGSKSGDKYFQVRVQVIEVLADVVTHEEALCGEAVQYIAKGVGDTWEGFYLTLLEAGRGGAPSSANGLQIDVGCRPWCVDEL